jgi:hypothetical protein
LRKNTRVPQQVVYKILSSSSSGNIPVDNSLETPIGEQGGSFADDSHPAGKPQGLFAVGGPQGSFVAGRLGSSPPTVAYVGEVTWMMPLADQRHGQPIVHLVFSNSSSSFDCPNPPSELDNARPQGFVE